MLITKYAMSFSINRLIKEKIIDPKKVKKIYESYSVGKDDKLHLERIIIRPKDYLVTILAYNPEKEIYLIDYGDNIHKWHDKEFLDRNFYQEEII